MFCRTGRIMPAPCSKANGPTTETSSASAITPTGCSVSPASWGSKSPGRRNCQRVGGFPSRHRGRSDRRPRNRPALLHLRPHHRHPDARLRRPGHPTARGGGACPRPRQRWKNFLQNIRLLLRCLLVGSNCRQRGARRLLRPPVALWLCGKNLFSCSRDQRPIVIRTLNRRIFHHRGTEGFGPVLTLKTGVFVSRPPRPTNNAIRA